jgi:single-strand DNA-binding protein
MTASVTLVGNLTRDPEIRYTAGGQAVASFGLAVNRRWQQNGEWQEKVSFFNITAWGTLGENTSHSLQKGARVIVSGRLEQREYETKDGERRNVVEVVADEIGPSLRWATAQVDRNDRRPAEDGSFAGSGGGGGRSSSAHSDEEEPF